MPWRKQKKVQLSIPEEVKNLPIKEQEKYLFDEAAREIAEIYKGLAKSTRIVYVHPDEKGRLVPETKTRDS